MTDTDPPQTLYEARQQLKAERERYADKGITPFTGGYIRPKPTAAEEAETSRLNAARALPDEMFFDDPEVQRLRDDLGIKAALIEQRIPVKNWLSAQMARMDLAVKAAEHIIPQIILEDAAAQDDGFTRTREAIEALNFAKTVLAYADAAYDVVAPSNPAAQHALYEARDAAQTALNERLFSLKKAHVDALARAEQEQNEGGM